MPRSSCRSSVGSTTATAPPIRSAVVSWPSGTRRPDATTFYLTNIGPQVLSAEEGASLYSMRWEIELCFRELKSSYALDKFRTTNPDVVEALIWSALLILTAARRLHTLIRQRAPSELRARCTQLRFAIHFRRGAQCVLACLLEYLGFERAERSSHRGMNLYLVEESLDPHVYRQRFREV